MRFDDVWIAGTGGVVGDLVSIEESIADGTYDAVAAQSSGMVSYSRSSAAPPEMAVVAGREAIQEAADVDVEVAEGSFFAHSHSHFQGIDLWPAECWIAGALLGKSFTGMPVTVGAASNGSLAGLLVAASMLTAHREIETAIVTVADRFGFPIDRWNLSPGMVFGDGGGSAVLTRGRGRLRLESLVSETDTALEGLSRGDEPFSESSQHRVDSKRRTREFLAAGGLTLRDIRTRSAAGIRKAAQRALTEAGSSLGEVDWFIPPFVGKTLYQEGFVRPLDAEPRQTLAALGRTVGHLGPADHLYALSHLIKHELLGSGDRVLLIGTGMGFTFSAAVLVAAP